MRIYVYVSTHISFKKSEKLGSSQLIALISGFVTRSKPVMIVPCSQRVTVSGEGV